MCLHVIQEVSEALAKEVASLVCKLQSAQAAAEDAAAAKEAVAAVLATAEAARDELQSKLDSAAAEVAEMRDQLQQMGARLLARDQAVLQHIQVKYWVYLHFLACDLPVNTFCCFGSKEIVSRQRVHSASMLLTLAVGWSISLTICSWHPVAGH